MFLQIFYVASFAKYLTLTLDMLLEINVLIERTFNNFVSNLLEYSSKYVCVYIR